MRKRHRDIAGRHVLERVYDLISQNPILSRSPAPPKIAHALEYRLSASDGGCEFRDRDAVSRRILDWVCETDPDKECEIRIFRLLVLHRVPVRGYESGIFLFDDKTVCVCAECPYKVVIPLGMDVELWIAVDACDRIHDDRGHLNTYTDIDASVTGSDPVLINHLIHPVCTDPPGCCDHVFCRDSPAVTENNSLALVIADDKVRDIGIQQKLDPPLYKTLLEVSDDARSII